MNKNIIIGVIAVLVVAAGIWYWVSTPSTAGAPSTTATTTDTTAGGTGSTGTVVSGTGSLRTLVTRGGNYTCTISNTNANGAQSTGTIFGAGGQTRLDFKVSVSGTDFTMHTIRTATTAYTWIEGQQTGTKTAITASSPVVTPASGGVIAVDDTTQVSSECHPWSPVAADFVPPTGITFVAK